MKDLKTDLTTESEILERAKKGGRHDRMRPRYPRFLAPIALVLAVAVVLSGGYLAVVNNRAISDFFGSLFKSNEVSSTVDDAAHTLTAESLNIKLNAIETSVYGFMLNPGVDYDTSSDAELDALLQDAKDHRFNTVFLRTDTGDEVFDKVAAKSTEKELTLYGVFDLSQYDISKSDDIQAAVSKMIPFAQKNGVAGIMISGVKPTDNNQIYKRFLQSGIDSFDGFRTAYYKNLFAELSSQLRKTVEDKHFGIFINGTFDAKNDKICAGELGDVAEVIKAQIFELVMVEGLGATDSAAAPFEKMLRGYCEAANDVTCRAGVTVYSSKIGKEYKNPDQLTRELMAISADEQGAFCVDSLSALNNDTTGAAAAFYKYLKGEMADYSPKRLTFTSPAGLDFTTTSSSIAISGASDPEFELTVDGKKIERTASGFFGYQQDLKVGKNTFKFEHKGSTTVMTVNYQYTVLQSVSPSSAVTLDYNVGNLGVSAVARAGATVKATLGGSTITLSRKMTSEEQVAESKSEFVNYSGDFTMPGATYSDQTLGKVKFTATYNGTTQTKQSGTIKLKKKPAPAASSQTPSTSSTSSKPTGSDGGSGTASGGSASNSSASSGGTKYIGIQPGNTLLAVANKYYIETLDGNKTDDYSRPTNSYMPKDTVDTASATVIYANGTKYRNLGCGRRVYESNITTTKGSLPSSNTVSVNSFSTSGQYTVLTLGATFKMPVNINMLPQSYGNITTAQDYNISSPSFSYIEIYMPYATGISGSIPAANSPLFSRCETVKSSKGYTFKLYLKKTGVFYGYDISYNSSGNTVIKFLNPLHISGTNLTGLKVVVDAGHGGSDSGASAKDNKGKTITEAERCTYLANALTQRLRAKGATVITTRTTNVTLDRDVRIQTVRNSGAHYCISIHRNSSESTKPRAFKSYYFYPFTKTPAQYIFDATYASPLLYQKSTWSRVDWHYFFLSRISNMPVVLTENGFMSNPDELQQIVSNDFNDKCADRLVTGITKFFNNQ